MTSTTESVTLYYIDHEIGDARQFDTITTDLTPLGGNKENTVKRSQTSEDDFLPSFKYPHRHLHHLVLYRHKLRSHLNR